jgi:hypothetical protein
MIDIGMGICLCVIAIVVVCYAALLRYERDILIKKRKTNSISDILEYTIKHIFVAPQMFASTPESFEDQVCLLMTLKHIDKNIWYEFQTFKKKYNITTIQTISSKYDFESTPNITEIMKEFVEQL